MEKIENFSYVEMSCRLAFIALTELSYLNKERSLDQIRVVSSPPFQYYRISMQYMFVMEFNKLLEPDTKGKTYRKGETWEDFENRNFSSLAKISRKISESLGTCFLDKHEENKKNLEKLRKSDFYKDAKQKRDEEYAHMDRNKQNPLSLTSYSIEKINEAFQLMDIIKEVLNNCTSQYEGGYDFSFDYSDTRTDNFIAYHSLYEAFYDKNSKQAYEEGFYINPNI